MLLVKLQEKEVLFVISSQVCVCSLLRITACSSDSDHFFDSCHVPLLDSAWFWMAAYPELLA